MQAPGCSRSEDAALPLWKLLPLDTAVAAPALAGGKGGSEGAKKRGKGAAASRAGAPTRCAQGMHMGQSVLHHTSPVLCSCLQLVWTGLLASSHFKKERRPTVLLHA